MFHYRGVPFSPDPVPTWEEIQTFCRAADNGDRGEIQRLLDTYGPTIVNQRDSINACAMTWAAFAGRVDILDLLLSNGANIEGKGSDDRTAIGWAASLGRREAFDFLLKNGASLDAPDAFGDRPRDLALRNGHTDIVTAIDDHVSGKQKLQADMAAAAEKHARDSIETTLNNIKKRPVPKLKKG